MIIQIDAENAFDDDTQFMIKISHKQEWRESLTKVIHKGCCYPKP